MVDFIFRKEKNIYLLSRLKSQRCDEDVNENSKEDKNSGRIVHFAQPWLLLNIIQVILH